MKIHEYQAKDILRRYNVPTPGGFPAFTVDEAVDAAEKLGGSTVIVKAQIHAGGRGKGGGVKLAHSIEEVRQTAEQILGMNLVTHQTGPEGTEVKRLLIEEGVAIATELYAGIVLDRSSEKYVFMVSKEGGMEIEKVAAETPEKIVKEWIEPKEGLTVQQSMNLAEALSLSGEQAHNCSKTVLALWEAFIQSDCSLA
ncbi:MAG: acetate--CoA ligase family protein, partial [Candidatus Marinimicrobia bacterium]|nr:acetate--CoA ligase family protein [Candidatus Neomarinimicrobiota bacterium]